MTVRWGFLGAGWIAQRALAPAVHAAAGARLEAVASRDPDRSRALEPRRMHASYADLLADDQIDAVYVCLANEQHLEWVTRALGAGKHVLCEKPMGRDHAEAAAMAAAAAAADRLLVEAVWCRWHPRFQRLATLAREGALGALVSVDSAFTFAVDLRGNYRGDPARGGGALLDVGGYQVHAWRALADGRAQSGVEKVERTLGPTGSRRHHPHRRAAGTGDASHRGRVVRHARAPVPRRHGHRCGRPDGEGCGIHRLA